MFHPKKGQQMRNALLAAVCLLALPAPAHAGEIDCNGYRYGMRVRDLVTRDINDKKALTCEIPNNSRAWLQIKNWCNNDDFCTFKARVKRRHGKTYIIDRIVGPVS
jgi:hypothetical protein